MTSNFISKTLTKRKNDGHWLNLGGSVAKHKFGHNIRPIGPLDTADALESICNNVGIHPDEAKISTIELSILLPTLELDDAHEMVNSADKRNKWKFQKWNREDAMLGTSAKYIRHHKAVQATDTKPAKPAKDETLYVTKFYIREEEGFENCAKFEVRSQFNQLPIALKRTIGNCTNDFIRNGKRVEKFELTFGSVIRALRTNGEEVYRLIHITLVKAAKQTKFADPTLEDKLVEAIGEFDYVTVLKGKAANKTTEEPKDTVLTPFVEDKSISKIKDNKDSISYEEQLNKILEIYETLPYSMKLKLRNRILREETYEY